MATYYWVGGSGTWDASTTTNWALSSGGAGSAGFPTSSDSVIFDLNSGAAPVVTISTAVCSACTIGAPTSGTLILAFGSSTLTASGNFSVTTTISVTGTGTITCAGTSPTFNGNNNTFYNVSFTSAANGTTTINGANTFNNLSQTSRSANGRRIVQLNESQTVGGTLTLGAANTSIRRIRVQSNVIGTQRTITLNGTLATLADVDFQNINAAGTVATPWTGTRLGNCLGNANITFDTPKNVYRVGTGNWSATQWSLSSGGSVDTNNFPLAQDTAIFDTGTVTGTHTFDQPWSVGTLDCSALNVAVTIATQTLSPVFFKDVILDSDVTLTGTGNLQFQGQGTTQTITSAGVSIPQSIIVNSPSGTVQLLDAFTQDSTRTFTITNGTVQLKNGVISTVGAFATSGTTQKFLQSTLAGSQATLSQASGTVNASYLTIKDIDATGGATWNALWSNNNVDLGNNTGWFFGDQPIINAVEYTYKIRSFTQPRRF